MSKFKPINDGLSFLLPPNIEEFVPEDHLARTVVEVVDMLDTSCIDTRYSDLGQKTYHPKIMLRLLFYGYATGIRSGRKIAQRCVSDTAFMYLSNMYSPDFRTINDFRKNNLEEIEKYFIDIVKLCKEIGLIKLGAIAIDGSKMKANAATRKTKDRDGYEKWHERVSQQMHEMLEDGIRIDEEEDELFGEENTGDELPEELRGIDNLRRRIKEAMDELEGEKKKNFTDNDARFMKQGTRGIKAGYNTRIAASENQVITAADVTTEPNDRSQLAPMIEQSRENLGEDPDTILADSGYASYDNYDYLAQSKLDALIPDMYYRREKEKRDGDDYRKENFTFDRENNRYICPEGKPLEFFKKRLEARGKAKRKQIIFKGTACSECPVKSLCTGKTSRTVVREMREELQEEMRRKLDSDEGRKTYKKRMHMVEPIFGNLKYNLGYETFSLRTHEKVRAEFKLMCIGNNLKKIWQSGLATS
ncbi:MAG: IS1182 family transposase [Dehalococcoidales bacterium]|nr:IS1182 family transposase [Dehalococcoidales bacterium]